jgi:phosphoribosyl 1,2-cyclic phosphate phosphodiesterase
MRQRLPVWADGDTQNALYARFGYAFVQPEDSPYPPILDMHTINGPFEIEGAGGAIRLTPFQVNHGSIDALGFRVGDLAYLPDAAAIPEDVWPVLSGLDCWILDALRRTPHPTHAHLALSLEWIARAAPRRAVLTNMHIDLDYQTVEEETPAHVTPAYDGMILRYTV